MVETYKRELVAPVFRLSEFDLPNAMPAIVLLSYCALLLLAQCDAM